MIRVLAVDPSLTGCATAHDTHDGTITTNLITTRPPTDERRLLTIAAAIRHTAHDAAAQIVAIEGLAPHAKGRSFLDLAGLHWTIRNTLYGAQIPVLVIGQARIKKYATGKGNASKDEVLAAAIRRLNYDGHDNNIADALWLHALVKDACGEPVLELPKSHRDAAAKITIPDLRSTA